MTDRQTYVIDTNVPLADPDALVRFDEHHVVVPLVVIEELDRTKDLSNDLAEKIGKIIRDFKTQSRPVAVAAGG